jgi:hypothetical protein
MFCCPYSWILVNFDRKGGLTTAELPEEIKHDMDSQGKQELSTIDGLLFCMNQYAGLLFSCIMTTAA